MGPFLAIFLGNPEGEFSEIRNHLEKDTPVDFLLIDASDTEDFTYRYTTKQSLYQDLKEISGDYASLLLIGKTAYEIFESNCQEKITDKSYSIWQVDPLSKKVSCNDEDNIDLMRYFFIRGYQVYILDTPQKFKGLSLTEFILITQMICLNEGDTLDALLRKEALLCFPNKPTALEPYSFIQTKETPQTKGIIRIAEKSKQEETTTDIPIFHFLKPSLHIWVYSKAFATAGSLDYDLQKLIKEMQCRKEEIKYCAFTSEASLNDHIFSFMDNFETDNELELAFNLDTIRLEIEEFAKTKGLFLLGERSSKTSRILLLGSEKRDQ